MMLSNLVRDALSLVLQSKQTQQLLRSSSSFGVVRSVNESVTLADLPDSSPQQLQDFLQDICIASDQDWKDNVLEALDLVYAHNYNENRKHLTVDWHNLPSNHQRGGTDIILYQGDITTLNTDAIVNAANDQGLGCFIPNHRCIDNVIHRQAGPRLRQACRHAIAQRHGQPLAAGTVPIVTPAFHLPSRCVVHVTGPQLQRRPQGLPPTAAEEAQLAAAYWNGLNACVQQHDLKSIAFCGISTGLFGFPKFRAAEIAVATVQNWLDQHPQQLDAVVFDVFGKEDYEIYQQVMQQSQGPSAKSLGSPNGTAAPAVVDVRQQKLAVVKQALEEADTVLICAGAGMSVKPGEMVYTNPQDFAKHYPWFVQWGYRTSYEVMGLGADPSVPETAKWALHAKHMDNMRWKFTPNEGYDELLKMVQNKDYFVLTSNVDGCFERAGFDPDRIYTPQGEWTYYQCRRPCRPDAVFESRPLLDKLVPLVDETTGRLPEDAVPRCPYCGGSVFGNVRGGSWFLHTPYERQNNVLRHWMREVVQQQGMNKKVVVLEIGAGFNTPTVTRFPVESFARQLGDRATFVRINPSSQDGAAAVPEDLDRAVSLAEGWSVLGEIAKKATIATTDNNNAAWQSIQLDQNTNGDTTSADETRQMQAYFGHFDWNRFLLQLKGGR